MKRLIPAVAVFLALTAVASDTPSDECLSCHGGTAGPTIQQHSSHPWGIDYATAARGSGRKALRSTVAADLLVNGRVECTSCHVGHDVATDLKYRLRDSVPSLCIGCHDPARL